MSTVKSTNKRLCELEIFETPEGSTVLLNGYRIKGIKLLPGYKKIFSAKVDKNAVREALKR